MLTENVDSTCVEYWEVWEISKSWVYNGNVIWKCDFK